jgi:hypothetical protein
MSAGLAASTLWLALIVGLFVQGFVIYAAVRFALLHDRRMVIRQQELAGSRARNEAAAKSEVARRAGLT